MSRPSPSELKQDIEDALVGPRRRSTPWRISVETTDHTAMETQVTSEPGASVPEDETTGTTPELICMECGHSESDHIEQTAEIPGATMRRTLCDSCESFHEFTPDSREL